MAEHSDPRSAAISRLRAKRGFLQNLVTYVVVNVFLVIVWAFSGAGYFWPIWIIGGWGVGLAMHAWAVYGRKGITEEDIQREIQRGGGAL